MAPSLRHRQGQSLSPRQLFQSQVRDLNEEDPNRGHRRNKSISLKYNPYELQHVSSLRVQNHHLRSSSRSPTHGGTPALRRVQEEPDFVLEEREAWSRRSPTSKTRPSPHQQARAFVLHDEALSEDEVQQEQRLRPFAPLKYTIDVNDRPKTSRGPGPVSGETGVNLTAETSAARSKFMEGSMTNRSQGTASSWMDHASDYDSTASETEDDSTPKASERHGNGEVDLRDFDPPSASSSTVRRTLFRRKSSTQPPGEEVKPKKKKKQKLKENSPKRSRKRLRKSLSTWSLHGLGEKMGIVNNSTSSVDTGTVEAAPNNVPTVTTQQAVLDERKRKADIAYSQQFGLKKQKDNSGAAAAAPILGTEPDPYSTVRLRSAKQDPNATIKARSATRTRRTSLGPSDLAAVFKSGSDTDHDARKRPTRRELEKENQHLREMLRKSQSGHFSLEPLTQQSRQIQPDQLLHSPQNEQSVFTNGGMIVPPPRLSSNRKSLDNINNVQNSHASLRGNAPLQISSVNRNAPNRPRARNDGLHMDLSPRPSLPDLPRSVGMIVEEPEGEEGGDQKLNNILNKRVLHSSSSIRRRHSMHSGDPQKIASVGGKENSRPHGQAKVPTIIVSAATDGSGESRTEWQGWDDDVF